MAAKVDELDEWVISNVFQVLLPLSHTTQPLHYAARAMTLRISELCPSFSSHQMGHGRQVSIARGSLKGSQDFQQPQ